MENEQNTTKKNKERIPYYVNGSLLKTIKKYSKEYGKNPLRYGFKRLVNHTLNIIAQTIPWNKTRVILQRWRGVKIGENVHIGPYTYMDAPFPEKIQIEDRVTISGHGMILTHNQPSKYFSEAIEAYKADVIIHKNAWICIFVSILPGVEIGEGSIVSAYSRVNKDIPAFTVCGGVPAKVIRDISNELKRNYDSETFKRILREREDNPLFKEYLKQQNETRKSSE